MTPLTDKPPAQERRADERPAQLIVIGLVSDGRAEEPPRYWVTLRKKAAHVGGLWELPGGKVDGGERPDAALVRELREELGVVVDCPRPLTFAYHDYGDRSVLLLVMTTRIRADSPAPRALASDGLRCVSLQEMLTLPMPAANTRLLERIARLFASAPQAQADNIDIDAEPTGDTTGSTPGDGTGSTAGDNTGSTAGDNTGSTAGDNTGSTGAIAPRSPHADSPQ